MSVEERLERLERQNKWMRRLGAVGVALVATVILMGQGKASQPAKVVVAEKFVLMDSDGKTWGEWGTDRGLVRLLLRDQEGHDLVRLSANEEGTIAALVLMDKGGTNRVELGGGIEGAGLNLNDWKGHVRARLYAAPDDDESALTTTHLGFLDKSGKVFWKAPKY